jgi:hypothetical protein
MSVLCMAVNAAANAVQMAVALGQGADENSIDGESYPKAHARRTSVEHSSNNSRRFSRGPKMSDLQQIKHGGHSFQADLSGSRPSWSSLQTLTEALCSGVRWGGGEWAAVIGDPEHPHRRCLHHAGRNRDQVPNRTSSPLLATPSQYNTSRVKQSNALYNDDIYLTNLVAL